MYIRILNHSITNVALLKINKRGKLVSLERNRFSKKGDLVPKEKVKKLWMKTEESERRTFGGLLKDVH